MRATILILLGLSLGGLLGCKEITGRQSLPSGVQDPATFSTPAGALGMRVAAIEALQQELPSYIVNAGLLTDEITSCPNCNNGADPLDERILPEMGYGVFGGQPDFDYGALQHVRGLLAQARGAVAAYDTGAAQQGDPVALRSELYALEGYTEILLADFFCSGVPLSTLDFEKDFTYRPSSTTAQVYQDAIEKLDSALVLARAQDSVGLEDLALVLKGRAWLALGQYDSAAATVAVVPDAFRYQLMIPWKSNSRVQYLANGVLPLSDREGSTGLPFLSSGDPRTRDSVTQYNNTTVLVPTRYSLVNAFSPFVVADGIEARLIRAEAALRTGDVTTWLANLNQLRTNGLVTTPPDTMADTLGVTDCDVSSTTWGLCGSLDTQFQEAAGQPAGGFPVPAGYSFAAADTTYPAHTIILGADRGGLDVQAYCNNNSWYEPCYGGDSMVVNLYVKPGSTGWSAGTGGVSGLNTLVDPGTDSGRVSLMFRERAFWLYLTGHREGDLRRLVRAYSRDPEQVYPTGPYQGHGAISPTYGTDVTAPIPGDEYLNPFFHGCLSRRA